jgi:energy-coupling factor transporter ATP-binding protein EcfA2
LQALGSSRHRLSLHLPRIADSQISTFAVWFIHRQVLNSVERFGLTLFSALFHSLPPGLHFPVCGKAQRAISPTDWFVLQENYLFDDTIAKNIAFGEEEPDLERVAWAAKVANAHKFIQRLPLGFETRVGETGIALSGGQRQRIAMRERCTTNLQFLSSTKRPVL